jgi:DNA polymerase III subunit epsilon
MIERVLIIDTETTALEPSKGQVVEVAAILYSVKNQTIIQQVSTLLPAKNNPAEIINRISTASLEEITIESALLGINLIVEMAKMTEYVVAHNAEFDKQWFGLENNGKSPDGSDSNNNFGAKVLLPILLDIKGQPLPWLCTMTDFKFPKQNRPRQSLVDLVLAHDIGVYGNHRALSDCQLIAALFNVMDDLQGLFTKAIRPKACYIALVSYEDRNLAKQAGFHWVPDTKTWQRVMAMDDVKSLPFLVKLAS